MQRSASNLAAPRENPSTAALSALPPHHRGMPHKSLAACAEDRVGSQA